MQLQCKPYGPRSFKAVVKPRLSSTNLQPLKPRLSQRSSIVAQARGGAAQLKEGYVCIDCGFIYTGDQPFKSLPGSYRCPTCNSSKNRFKLYKGTDFSNNKKSQKERMLAMTASTNPIGEMQGPVLAAVAVITPIVLGVAVYYAYVTLI